MLQVQNAALIVIDIQGKLATLMHQREEFYEAVVRTIEGAKTIDLPIIWNEQLPDKLGPTIEPVQKALSEHKPLAKKSFSCCGNSGFVDELRRLNRKQVLLVGMETHICVYQTARDLLEQGYEVFVVADGVSSRTLENKQIGLRAMEQAGAQVTCVEMALFEMLQVAEGEQFRRVIKIVK